MTASHSSAPKQTAVHLRNRGGLHAALEFDVTLGGG